MQCKAVPVFGMVFERSYLDRYCFFDHEGKIRDSVTPTEPPQHTETLAPLGSARRSHIWGAFRAVDCVHASV